LPNYALKPTVGALLAHNLTASAGSGLAAEMPGCWIGGTQRYAAAQQPVAADGPLRGAPLNQSVRRLQEITTEETK
jgi:hypothetical protein